MSKVYQEQPTSEFRFHKLVFYIKTQIPKFRLRSKKDSTLMQLLSVVLFFNKDFLDKYVTTIYPSVYVPDLPWDKQPVESRITTLAHEYVHLKDRERLGWLFNILYLSPQIFALLAIGAIWNSWWLLSLLFLLPWPSPGRAWLEARAYKVTIVLHWHLTKREISPFWIREQFTGTNYYWMWPFKKDVERRTQIAIENSKSGKFLSPEILEILEALEV